MKLMHETFFEKLAEKLHSDSGVRRAYGEPIEFEGRKIIPVADITFSYGFGEGGAGEGEKPAEGEAESSPEKAAQAGGYGYGGTTKSEPLGVIEITPDGSTFLPIRPRRELAKGLVLGLALGLILARLLRR